MNIKTKIAFILCLSSSFVAAMEQQPNKMPYPKSNALYITIPATNYKDSDEESSLSTERLARTSAGSPLRSTQSGSPLLRLSQQNSTRRHVVSPRIEQEMQENNFLKPKEKKLTPRSQAIYDVFGDCFDETTYHLQHSSDEQCSSDSVQALSPKVQFSGLSKSTSFHPLQSYNKDPQMHLKTSAQTAFSPQKLFSPRNHLPAPMTHHMHSIDINDPHGTRLMETIFPYLFEEMEVFDEKEVPPTVLLQMAMMHNNYELVERCLIIPEKNASKARKYALDAASDAAEKAANFSMAIQRNGLNQEKLQKDAHKAIIKTLKARKAADDAIALAGRPEANRISLAALCGSLLNEDQVNDSVFKGEKIVGLCGLLLPAHLVKAKSCNEKEYLDTLSKINTAVWKAHQEQLEYTAELEDLFNSIRFHIQTV